ncbi:unnamed protein product [Paramecium primaurelia]|uniref:VWFA domain-containing protein n=1 Tax=Paramecium primaurelia TaxID=5886 RepID=A0A8S1JR59_PARPR|nr:unnamed protein product [Paramecium primaurelia]
MFINHLEKRFPNQLELVQENNFKNQISFQNLDDFAANLIQDENLLASYQNEKNKTNEKFEELWNVNLNELKKKNQDSLKKLSEKEFLRVLSKCKKYNLDSDKKEQIEQFTSNLIMNKLGQDDFDQSFNIMHKDLTQSSVFEIFEFINRDKTDFKQIEPRPIKDWVQNEYKGKFQKIITQIYDIEKTKLISSHIQLSNLEIQLKWISIRDLENYFKNKANIDLTKFCENKDQREATLQFFDLFKIFGYRFNTDKFDEFQDLVIAKKEKTILDYLIYQEIPFKKYYLNNQNELNFLDRLSISPQTTTIKASEELDERTNFIIDKKIIYNQNTVVMFQKDKFEKDYKLFDLIMDFKNDWKNIYEKIYRIIEQEFRANETQFHISMIQLIMDKVEKQIDQFNQCFFQYGAILGNVGQKIFYNFAIFIFWRYLCYQRYQQYIKYENEELSLLKKEKFDKFMADIQQNQSMQSLLNGKAISKLIIDQSIKQHQINLINDAYKELDQLVNDPKMQSYYLINDLDEKLFNQKEKQNSYSQTQKYIDNPVKFIEDEVTKRTGNMRQQFVEQYSQKLRENVNKDLSLILSKLSKIQGQAIENQKATEFFIQLINPQDAPKILYQIVMKYLVGNLSKEDLDNIQDKFKSIFQISNDQCKIAEQLLQAKDQRINILSDFVSGFIIEVKEQIQQLKVSNYFIEQYIQKIRYNLIGCRECCPTCKRKCDIDISKVDHKHECRNEHAIRGMAGILVEQEPSLYSCKEIKHDYLVQEFDSSYHSFYMRDIRDMFKDWDIQERCSDKKTNDKFNVIWNNIGKDYCCYRFGRSFTFNEKQSNLKENQQSYHYVILLDDSGSMSGDRFNQAQNGILSFLQQAQQNQNIRVTIIIFNSTARCVVDCSPINMQTIKNVLVCNDGGTSFQSAFQLAYEKLQAVRNFDQFNKHIIFFYTDGEDSYPTQALEQFARMSNSQRMKIDLIACCLDKQQKTMIDITDFFNRNCSLGKLQDSMQPSEIGEAWTKQIRTIIV